MRIIRTFKGSPKPTSFKRLRIGDTFTLNPTDQSVYMIVGKNYGQKILVITLDEEKRREPWPIRTDCKIYRVNAEIKLHLPASAE